MPSHLFFALAGLLALTTVVLSCFEGRDVRVEHGELECNDQNCTLSCDDGYIATETRFFDCQDDIESLAKCVRTMVFMVGKWFHLK